MPAQELGAQLAGSEGESRNTGLDLIGLRLKVVDQLDRKDAIRNKGPKRGAS